MPCQTAGMRLFISYSHQNKDLVERLHKNLVAHSRAPDVMDIWIDVKDMAVGVDLSLQMHKGISEADCVVLCLSASYVASKSCMFEARLARALDKPAIPVVLEGQYPFDSEEIIEVLGPGILRIEGSPDSFVDKIIDSLPSVPISIDTGQKRRHRHRGSPGEAEAMAFIESERLTDQDLGNLKSVARNSPHVVSDMLPRRLSLAGRLALLRVANDVKTSRGGD